MLNVECYLNKTCLKCMVDYLLFSTTTVLYCCYKSMKIKMYFHLPDNTEIAKDSPSCFLEPIEYSLPTFLSHHIIKVHSSSF